MEQAGSKNNWHDNKKLRPLAKALRKNMTKAEACLWKYTLRSRKMMDYPFTRQRPLLNYIVDFMCKELCLVIEVDGLTHLSEDMIEKDKVKQENLEKAGFIVLRFRDEQVLNCIDLVSNEIEDTGSVSLSVSQGVSFSS
jgi:very-short-patch-repair endonuclease